jgi:hypothetical protein
MVTALIGRPDRLIYLSGGLHHAGAGSLRDIDWTGRSSNAAQAYAESKLQVTALALTPRAHTAGRAQHLTQTWLAVSNDAAAVGLVPPRQEADDEMAPTVPTPTGRA